MTTETDAYLAAVEAIGCVYIDINEDAAAAYLRKRFVTREEHEKAQETVRRVQASARTLTATQAEIYERYHKATGINTEAVATLDSEREANAILTAEVAVLTAERGRLLARIGAMEDAELRDIELEEALKSVGIYAYGPDAERFETMFAAAMRARQALNQEPTNG